jgi:hypothetical protein
MDSYNEDERNVHGVGGQIETKLPGNPTLSLLAGKIFVLSEIRYAYPYDERITRETADGCWNILPETIMGSLHLRIAKIVLGIPFAWLCTWEDIARMAGKLERRWILRVEITIT